MGTPQARCPQCDEESMQRMDARRRQLLQRVRSRLQCEEGDAAAVMYAAAKAKLTSGLKEIIGDYDAEAAPPRTAWLSTVVADDDGDYVLEAAREACEKNAGPRRERPARITFLVQGRDARGARAAVAIPADIAWANDDAAQDEPERIRPLVAEGETTEREIRGLIAYAYGTETGTDEETIAAAMGRRTQEAGREANATRKPENR